VDNIVVAGMGGSAFTPEIVKTLFAEEIKLPYEIVREYHLPGYVTKRSLVIISSYSATTKEAISCGMEALKIGCKVLVICSHREKNELFILAKSKKIPGYIFKEHNNPSLQPRLGGGYTVFGHAGLLIKTGLINIDFPQLKNSILEIEKTSKYGVDIPLEKNQAKLFAKKLYNRFPILVSSEFLQGAIHGFANQLNECSKTHSSYHFIPELNHHRMEGLLFPDEFKKLGIFVFYKSNLFDKKNILRYQITEKVIKRAVFKVLEYEAKGQDKIAQCVDTILFNSYTSFYLGMLNKVDPVKIPWVDYFKEELKKLERN
jgi:glucose/mannose-6-phosphate isomerase